MKNTPRTGFEPAIPKGQAFQACAIPDYATVAVSFKENVFFYKNYYLRFYFPL